eukprot:371692_1
MKSTLIILVCIAILGVRGYDYKLSFPCPLNGIGLADVPFTNGDLDDLKVINYINENENCWFGGFVNNLVDYDFVTQNSLTSATVECEDGECYSVSSDTFINKANAMRAVGDLVSLEYEITAVIDYGFTFSGKRTGRFNVDIGSYSAGDLFETEFTEIVTFDEDGTVLSKEMNDDDSISALLLEYVSSSDDDDDDDASDAKVGLSRYLNYNGNA